MTDEEWMRWALRLAESARGQTSPNPLVGAVVVRDGEIVGQGAHLRAGGPHAEIHALRMAGERARGAVMYVTLEPCDHHGRTPPCTRALIEHGIARVVVAMVDPDPRVSGRGIARLREAGIAVDVGVLEKEARELNRGFLRRVVDGRPWVTGKAGMTLDGHIATWAGDSRWITGEEARRDVHRIRAEVDAIITGIGTVLADDPLLTARAVPPRGGHPVRVVLDSRLRIPDAAKILDVSEAPTVVCCLEGADPARAEMLRSRGVEVWTFPEAGGGVDPAAVLRRLAERGVCYVLLEAGGKVQGSFLRAGLVDQVLLYLAPKLLCGEGIPAFAGRGVERLGEAVSLDIRSVERIGKDWKVDALVRYPGEGAGEGDVYGHH
ncbi:MAG: bifunctional diaminohydroxyphosphoribosylaminopyrimidine deaminase/5-amino-6-(5-phosphoribosylamino)uracil reductase RibD [Alicyclobacillaceae bacterium]|nr:bifunctional diaminohydroxyphosphoribosylaminopyrimidine deaminase/5-amino-6-(5-phosphoribosylamino)uracil reductase RibD [Alicyclobacillaceae bacterium]